MQVLKVLGSKLLWIWKCVNRFKISRWKPWPYPEVWVDRDDNSAIVISYDNARPGLPNVRPPGQFYAAPGPTSKYCAGRKNYYCYLLIVHFHIHTADFLFYASELPVCWVLAYTLSLLNQCRPTIVLRTLTKDSLLWLTCSCLGLHGRRLCTRYCYVGFKTYVQSPGPTKSYTYYRPCLNLIHVMSLTTIFNTRTRYFFPKGPELPTPELFWPTPSQKIFSRCAQLILLSGWWNFTARR